MKVKAFFKATKTFISVGPIANAATERDLLVQGENLLKTVFVSFRCMNTIGF